MLFLKIISPEKIVFQGEVKSVIVPGEVGEFEILNNHAPIISTLIAGRMGYTTDAGKEFFQIRGGFVEVKQNEVNLCVEM